MTAALTPQSALDFQETIVALSSAPGPGARAIVRVTGKTAWELIRGLFRTQEPWSDAIQRGRWSGGLRWPGLHAPLPAEVLVWTAPRTYTGQDLIEIHTISSPTFIDALLAHLLRAGARVARPGEFTLRAFLAGKLDLTQAEAVLGVIEAGDTDELQTALAQLAGGMARPLQRVRDDLLNLLAEVEAGLDFAEEDLRFISLDELLNRLRSAQETLAALQVQLERRTISGRPFRVVLTGRPNAGKSSLFNALAGRPLALVSPEPGTTRDYLVQRWQADGVEIELIDTAGRVHASGESQSSIDAQAQRARKKQSEKADLLLVCLDATCSSSAEEATSLRHDDGTAHLGVWTKCDLLPQGAALSLNLLRTSATTGIGLGELSSILADHARQSKRPAALAPCWSRCRHHVETALDHVRQAAAIVAAAEPAELLALELRLALDALGEMVGTIYTEDLLDRIFGQFCIGK